MKAAIDWASEHHDLCVVDDAGRSPASAGTPYQRRVQAAARDACPLRRSGRLPIAIERPDGVLVETLLDAGHPGRADPAGGVRGRPRPLVEQRTKSDRADAYQLADFLRTDGHRFRTLNRSTIPPVSCAASCGCAPTTSQRASPRPTNWRAAGRALARRRPDLRAPGLCDRARVPRQLPDRRQCPTTLREAPRRLPAPPRLQRPQNRRRPARTAAQRTHPTATARPRLPARPRPLPEPPVRTLLDTIAHLDAAISALIGQHRKARVIQSLPRSGTISAAQLLAEIGPTSTAPRAPNTPPPKPEQARSPAPPANNATAPASATPPTPNPAKHSPSGPTTAATAPPGQCTSTAKPACAAAATPTPSASSPAPGCASSTNSGTPTPPTTPRPTATPKPSENTSA